MNLSYMYHVAAHMLASTVRHELPPLPSHSILNIPFTHRKCGSPFQPAVIKEPALRLSVPYSQFAHKSKTFYILLQLLLSHELLPSHIKYCPLSKCPRNQRDTFFFIWICRQNNSHPQQGKCNPLAALEWIIVLSWTVFESKAVDRCKERGKSTHQSPQSQFTAGTSRHTLAFPVPFSSSHCFRNSWLAGYVCWNCSCRPRRNQTVYHSTAPLFLHHRSPILAFWILNGEDEIFPSFFHLAEFGTLLCSLIESTHVFIVTGGSKRSSC